MKNHLIFPGTLVLAFLLFFVTQWSFAEEIVLSPGDDIQEAINKAKRGDTIFLTGGDYYIQENLLIEKKRNFTLSGDLTGEVKARIICESMDFPVISIYDSTDVNISMLEATHLNPEEQEYSCSGSVIEASGSKKILIEYCDLNGCGTIGVALYGCEDVLITDCIIHNNSDTALYFYTSKNIAVRYCTIKDNQSFLYLYDVQALQIEYINEDNPKY